MTSAELSPSLGSPPSSPRLPVELLARIVDEATGNRDEPDHTTLRRICLTSRCFLPFGRAGLYRIVCITFTDTSTSNIEEKDGVSAPDEAAPRVHLSPSGEHFKAAIDTSPHLAQSVERVVLRFENEEWVGDVISSKTLKSILKSCPQVRRLEVRGAVAADEAKALEAALLSHSPPLSQLTFAPGKTFDRILSRLPTLKHLELFEARGKAPSMGKKVFPYPSQLVSLTIDNGAPLPTVLFVLRTLHQDPSPPLHRQHHPLQACDRGQPTAQPRRPQAPHRQAR